MILRTILLYLTKCTPVQLVTIRAHCAALLQEKASSDEEYRNATDKYEAELIVLNYMKLIRKERN